MPIRRSVVLVLFLIGLATAVSFTILGLAYYAVTREPELATGSLLSVRVDGDLAEVEPAGLVGQLLATTPTVRSVVDALRKAETDDRVAGVILEPVGGGGMWGQVQEIRDAVLDFKRSGKPIVAYLEYGGDQEYYLATACDRVYLMPTSPLDLAGVAMYELFLRGTFDKIGAYPDLMHIGDYKSAANNFTEQDFTPEHREMTESLVQDTFEQLVAGIAAGRKQPEAEIRALIDRGPFLAEEALAAGLVDGLAYRDEVAARLDDEAAVATGQDDATPPVVDLDDYGDVSLESLGLNRGPKVAVVYAVGLITRGESSSDSSGNPVLGSDTIVEHLRSAGDDEEIRAIVLRIDSPGGSALASDVIWREVVRAAERKPLIASMSDVAASGGYYIAMPAHAIVAQPATLTGSIGIVAGKIVTGGTFDKLGANIEAVSRGRFATMHTPERPYTPEEREKLTASMQATYRDFLRKAAQGRHTTPEEIHEVAQGRVWTGHQAQQVGLVDEVGGLQRAVDLAKARAGIAAGAGVEIVIYPPRRPFFEMLRGPYVAQLARALGLPGGWFGPGGVGLAERLVDPLRRFGRGEPLALMPLIGFQ